LNNSQPRVKLVGAICSTVQSLNCTMLGKLLFTWNFHHVTDRFWS